MKTPPHAAEPGARIDSVDGLRALAFLLVFAFRTWEFAGSPYVPVISGIVSQNTRPDFFVVLTGFVLLLPFARDPARTGRFRSGPYVQRRLRRIVLSTTWPWSLPSSCRKSLSSWCGWSEAPRRGSRFPNGGTCSPT